MKRLGVNIDHIATLRNARGGFHPDPLLAAKLAIKYGLACNTAGGSHHANYDGGAGYCVFNDVAVAAQYLLDRGLAGRILIENNSFS